MPTRAIVALGAVLCAALVFTAGCAPDGCRPNTEYGSCVENGEYAEDASCEQLM